jgi:hypothetical protein
MLKTFSVFSLIIGLLIAVALMSAAPETSGVAAQASEQVPPGCVAHEVALDEGYGVSRKSVTFDCDKN